MDLATLAVFRTVAREQSITRAAELLDRAPSNVTTRVQQLEAEVGVALFRREVRRMVLTAAGERYLDYAERILNLADEAQQVVNPSEPRGGLRIGAMECALASRLPRPLARFAAQWPQVAIELKAGPTRQLAEGVLAHRLDCALIAVPEGAFWLEPGALELTAVFREDLLLLLPPGHAGAERPRTLAAFGPGCTYRLLAEQALAREGLAAGLEIREVNSYHAMFACAAAGACLCVMPRSVAAMMGPPGQVEERPLGPVMTCLACRPGVPTAAIRAFRDCLLAEAGVGAPPDRQ